MPVLSAAVTASPAPVPTTLDLPWTLQWQYVLETEGAAGQSEDHGYLVVTARARTYGGQELEVQTLSVPDKIKARLQVG